MAAVHREKGEKENIAARDVKKISSPPTGSKSLCVLLPSHAGYEYGKQPVSIWGQNKKIAEVTRKHPARCVAFNAMDSRRDDVVRLIEIPHLLKLNKTRRARQQPGFVSRLVWLDGRTPIFSAYYHNSDLLPFHQSHHPNLCSCFKLIKTFLLSWGILP